LANARTLDAPGEIDVAAVFRPGVAPGDIPSYEIFLRTDILHPHQYWEIDDVELSLRGDVWLQAEGVDPETLEARTRIHLSDIDVNGYRADTVYAEARYDRGLVEVQPLSVLSPYLDLFASGLFDPSGTFSATARTTADADQAARAAELSDIRPAQADINLEVTGSFDPEIEPFVDSLQQAQVTSDWLFRGFEAEDIRIGFSQGSLEGGVDRRDDPAGTRYEADFRLDTRGRRLQMPDLGMAAWAATGRGQGAMVLPIEEPLVALRRLDTRWQATVSGLNTPQARVNDGRLQARLTKHPARPRTLVYDIDTTLSGLRLLTRTGGDDLRAGLLSTDLEGHLTLALEAEGLDMLTDLSARGTIEARGIDSPAAEAQEFTAAIDISGPPTNLTGAIDARARESIIAETEFETLNARMTFAPVRLFNLEVEAIRPEETVPVARLEAGGGYHEDLQGVDLTTLSLGTDRIIWTMLEPGRLTARADLLRFDNVRLVHDDQSITAHGVLRPGVSQDLDLNISGLVLEDLRRGFYLETLLPPIEGRFDLAASLDGTHRQPQVRAAGQLMEFHFDGEGPFGADIQLSYADEELRLETLHLGAYERSIITGSARLPVRVTLDGDVEVLWERPLDGQVTVVPFDFADFHRAVPWLDDHGVHGSGGGELHVRGTVEEPHVDISLRLEDFAFQGEVGEDFLDLQDLSWEADLVYSPVVGRRGGIDVESHIDWQGERVFAFKAAAPLPVARWLRQSLEEDEEPDFDWDGDLLTLPITLSLTIPDLALESIPLESARELDLAGRVSADIDLRGTLGNPEGHVNLGLRTFGFERFRDIYVDVNTTVGDRIIHVDQIRLEWDTDEILVAEGTLPVPIEALLRGADVQDLPGQFNIQLQELPIAKFSAMDYTFARIRGTVAAYLTIEGTLREPRFEARAGLFNTEFGDRRLGTIAASLQGANNQVQAQASLCREFETLATAEGDLPILLDVIELARGASPFIEGPLMAEAEGERLDLADILPVRLLETWVTDPAGMLDFAVQLAGTWEQPRATGHLTLDEGAVTLPRFGRGFEAIQARLLLDDDTLHVREISLRDGPSSLAVEGIVRHDLMRPQSASLQTRVRDFNLAGIATEFPVYVSADVDTQADLEAEPQVVAVDVTGLNVVLTDLGDRDLHPTEVDRDIMIVRRNARRTARDPRDLAELTTLRENGVDVLNMRVDVNVARDAWIRHP
ncbi:MAG: translocation/assembly module TamB domain-containing protein, partial [Bradymonadaceae bacterium]